MVNITFPILIRFGQFTGNTLCDWVKGKKLSIIPLLAETSGFDEEKFSVTLDDIQERGLSVIRVVNKFFLCWSILAAGVIIILLIRSGVMPNEMVSISENLFLVFFAFFPVLTGLVVFGVIYVLVRVIMFCQSWGYSKITKNLKEAQKDKIEAARSALRKKLSEQ